MPRREKKRGKLAATALCLGLAALMVGGVLCGSPSYAGGKIFNEEWKLPGFYPRGFNGYGRIDMIFADRIVISDMSRNLSSSVVYGVPSSAQPSKSAFRVGQMVGYLLDHRREIVSLWLIQ